MRVRFLPWLTIALLGLLPALPSFAASATGTCLRADGTLVAPWTDGFEPACGDDCGEDSPASVDDTDPEDAIALCSATPGDGCVDAPARLEMPAPAGPRCLDQAFDCGPDDRQGASPASIGGATLPSTAVQPAQRQSTWPATWVRPVVASAQSIDPSLDPPPPRR